MEPEKEKRIERGKDFSSLDGDGGEDEFLEIGPPARHKSEIDWRPGSLCTLLL